MRHIQLTVFQGKFTVDLKKYESDRTKPSAILLQLANIICEKQTREVVATKL